MAWIRYPECWKELSVVPSARAELVNYVGYVTQWNLPNSHVKRVGTHGMIDTLFNVFELDQGAADKVGIILFEDEAPLVDAFMGKFSEHFQRYLNDPEADDDFALYVLPDDVIRSAEELSAKLLERGRPEFL